MRRSLTISYSTELQRAAIQSIFDHLRGNQGRMSALQYGYISFDEFKHEMYYEDSSEYTHETDVLAMAIQATLNMAGITLTWDECHEED